MHVYYDYLVHGLNELPDLLVYVRSQRVNIANFAYVGLLLLPTYLVVVYGASEKGVLGCTFLVYQ